MPRLRLVVDTNVVVSAALKPISLPADALFFSFTSGDLYVSPEILQEYEETLSRPKFQFPPGVVKEILDTISENARVVRSHTRLSVADDPDDNKFLECALVSEADYLITGNLADYPERFETTHIVTPRQFLTLVGQL
jgi:putative PIN family toxin of toxin-antitoxin system